jgi:hypothetical protein
VVDLAVLTAVGKCFDERMGDAMLTLTEETGFLLYTHYQPAGGDAEQDIFARTSGEVSLLAGAALMDLLLRERLQVKLVSPRGRRLRVILGILSFLLVAAAFLVLPLQAVIDGSQLPGDIPPVAAFVGAVLFPVVFSLAVTLAFAQVLRDKLVLVDRTPTGDDVLNQGLLVVEQVGQQAPITRYLRSFGVRALSKLRDTLAAQLEQKGLVTPPLPGSTLFGLLDRRQVRRDHPEYQAISEQVRRLVLDHTAVGSQAAALLLLFAWSPYYWSFGGKAAGGVYQLFTRGEYRETHAFLRSVRRGNPAIAAQIGPNVYEALRAIAAAVRQRRKQESGNV